MSQKAQMRSLLLPAFYLLGQLAIIGTRMPPFAERCLPQPHSLLNGLALSKKKESLPPLKVGPLSLVKMMMVLS